METANNILMPGQITILGNKIDCFPGYRALFDYISVALESPGSSAYITVNNVHTLMEGYWSSSHQLIINNSFLSIADGKPLEVIGRLKGNKEITRLFGPTIMANFINWGREVGRSHFFFGSDQTTLQMLQRAVESKYPGAKIAGLLAPSYLPVGEWDNKSYIKIINEAKPDFIWIGLGAPKQERWIKEHVSEIDTGVCFCIGAGFDYLAGKTMHAPLWMKNTSLEWLFRLFQEPKRLWKRYFLTIPPFIFFAFLELFKSYLTNNTIVPNSRETKQE